MASFKDKENNRWNIELSIGTVRRVKLESNNLYDLFAPESDCGGQPLREVLWAGEGDFYEVLWLLLQPQAKELDITEEKFGELMAADCFVDAQTRFWEEWQSFFQRLQKPDRAMVLEKMSRFHKKAHQMMQAKFADEGIDKQIDAAMERVLNKSFSKLQESLDSTLVLTPGENSGGCTKDDKQP